MPTRQARQVRSIVVALAAILGVLLASSPSGIAQLLPLPPPSPAPAANQVVGRAVALQATVLGVTTALADAGYLTDDGDARGAALLSGAIPNVGGANVLTATTISSIDGWDAGDYVSSSASLADLTLLVAGTTIQAAFAMADAEAPVGAVGSAWSTVQGLSVNGVPIALTGTMGETIAVPGLTLVVNEILSSAGGVTVNALHIRSVDGLVDIIVASATAGVQ